MNRALILLALVVTLIILPGCHRHRQGVRHGCGNPYCDNCGGTGGGGGMSAASARVPHLPHGYAQQTGPAGPPTGQYAYPYYTTRGPRDFLANEPTSIGN